MITAVKTKLLCSPKHVNFTRELGLSIKIVKISGNVSLCIEYINELSMLSKFCKPVSLVVIIYTLNTSTQ